MARHASAEPGVSPTGWYPDWYPRRRTPALGGRSWRTPGVGLEPTTLRLTVECSAIELPRTVSYPGRGRSAVHTRTYRTVAAPASTSARSLGRARVRVAGGWGRGSVRRMDLHPGEEIVFDGHPSWRAVLVFYVAGIALVAVAAAIGALISGAVLAIPARRGRARARDPRRADQAQGHALRDHERAAAHPPRDPVQADPGDPYPAGAERQHGAVVLRADHAGRHGRLRHRRAPTTPSSSSSASRTPRRSSAPSTARSGRRRPRRGLRSRRPTRSSAAALRPAGGGSRPGRAGARRRDGDRLAGALGGGDLRGPGGACRAGGARAASAVGSAARSPARITSSATSRASSSAPAGSDCPGCSRCSAR